MGSEGSVVVTDEQIAAITPQQASGAMALAMMSEEAFVARLDSVQKGLDRVRQIQRRLMTDGEDFGTIPGTKKPTLLKPGAEKLCAFYGLVATYEIRTTYGDNVTRPWITVEAKAFMHLGAEAGPVVGEGYGSANSSESKHRYRSAKRSCPACGSVGSISKSKYADRETGDYGWYCRDCKANYHSEDQAITEQALGQIENPDPADVENTCLKMAKKRAFIDGTLTTTATSGLFTQDLEDGPADAKPVVQPAPTPGQARAARHAAKADPGDQPWMGDDDAPVSDREPGSDDVDPNDAYAKHNVEPPTPRRTTARSTPPSHAPGKVPCPHCGKLAGPSKFPKAGQTHYCYGCKHPFAPEA